MHFIYRNFSGDQYVSYFRSLDSVHWISKLVIYIDASTVRNKAQLRRLRRTTWAEGEGEGMEAGDKCITLRPESSPICFV